MNIHDHPNVKEYLAHFLLTLRKQMVLTEASTFEVEVHDEGLSAEDEALLR